jgi:hypothetical protein
VRGLVGDLVGAIILGVCWAAYYQVPLPGIRRFLRPAQGPITLAILIAATATITVLFVIQIVRLH